MPAGSEEVVIVGITPALFMTILNCLVLFPAVFCALTVMLNVPVAVGVPDITPVVPFKFSPVGSVPLEIDQVIGVVPVAASV